MQGGSPNVSLFVVAARTKKIAPGKFLAVKIRSFGNLGAFVSFRGAMPPRGQYRRGVRRLPNACAARCDIRRVDQHPLHLALSRRPEGLRPPT